MMDTCHRYYTDTVADPDLTTRGGLVIPAIRGVGGGGRGLKKNFCPLGSVWATNKGGSPGPSPESATAVWD